MEKQKLVQRKYREAKRKKQKKSTHEVFWFAIALLVVMVFVYFFGFHPNDVDTRIYKIE